MGAWGEKAFENDAALDWIVELEAGGLELLRATLSGVATTGSNDYVDLDEGSRAIAAAEVVAAGFGVRDAVVPPLRAWIDGQRSLLTEEDRRLAWSAAARVLEPGSELCEAWDENGADGPWHVEVQALIDGLGGNGEVTRTVVPPKSHRAVDSLLRDKQVLVTFLTARGLEPDAEQRARIETCDDPARMRRWIAGVTSCASVAKLLDE